MKTRQKKVGFWRVDLVADFKTIFSRGSELDAQHGDLAEYADILRQAAGYLTDAANSAQRLTKTSVKVVSATADEDPDDWL